MAFRREGLLDDEEFKRAKAKLLGPEEPHMVRIATHAWAPRGPETLRGLPRWPAGGSPKCHTVAQRSLFGGHFGTPFGGELAYSFTKSSKMGVQKVVKTGPLGRVFGELGCLLFFIEGLGEQPLIKTTITQAPQAPAQEGLF